jgi:hypothetical protein
MASGRPHARWTAAYGPTLPLPSRSSARASPRSTRAADAPTPIMYALSGLASRATAFCRAMDAEAAVKSSSASRAASHHELREQRAHRELGALEQGDPGQRARPRRLEQLEAALLPACHRPRAELLERCPLAHHRGQHAAQRVAEQPRRRSATRLVALPPVRVELTTAGPRVDGQRPPPPLLDHALRHPSYRSLYGAPPELGESSSSSLSKSSERSRLKSFFV